MSCMLSISVENFKMIWLLFMKIWVHIICAHLKVLLNVKGLYHNL